MTFDIVLHISEYMHDSEFMRCFSLLNKHKSLHNRRKYINRLSCSKLLYDKFHKIVHMDYIDLECKIIQEMLVNQSITYRELLDDFISVLLNHRHINPNRRHFTKMKCVVRNSYRNNFKIVNIPSCSIYRTTYSKKKYILKHTPYAKALIY